jgi:monoamine oxidase
MSEAFDVVVIGAGMAGLVAAREMARSGLQVCVVEAREQVGGRVMSVKTGDGGVAELGAEFVHGRAPELWALIREAGVHTAERRGPMVHAKAEGGLEEDSTGHDAMFEPIEELKEYKGQDMSFAEWARVRGLDAETTAAATSFVEGFNAADAKVIGVYGLGAQQVAEDESEGDRSWHVVGGYQQLAEFLAKECRALGVKLRLGCEVTAVLWSEGKVAVQTTVGELKASRCVVTLPLGVLHRVNAEGGVRIDPEPAAITQAKRLAMGHAARFTMVFRETWWLRAPGVDEKTLQELNFVMMPRRMPPVWWTSHTEPDELPRLTGWAGGPAAEALAGKTPEELAALGCAALSAGFGVETAAVREALLETRTHDWAADPLSLGAYSYVPAGSIDASSKMTEPEAGTLYVAGEHTDVTANWGTVHAAVRSGLRVAAQVAGSAR